MLVDLRLLDLIDTAIYRCSGRHCSVSIEAVAQLVFQTRPDLAGVGRELDDLIAASAISYQLPVAFDRLPQR